MKKWLLVLVVLGCGVAAYAKHVENMNIRYIEQRTLLVDNVQAAEHDYATAQDNYNYCIQTDWGSTARATAACYTQKIDLDDAHKTVIESRAALERFE